MVYVEDADKNDSDKHFVLTRTRRESKLLLDSVSVNIINEINIIKDYKCVINVTVPVRPTVVRLFRPSETRNRVNR